MAERRLQLGDWVSIGSLVLVLLGMGGGVSLYIYATKTDVTVVREQCQDKHAANSSSIKVLETHQAYQTSELQRVQAQLENMDARQQTDSRNITRLLERFRVRAESPPPAKPLPAGRPAPPGLDFSP